MNTRLFVICVLLVSIFGFAPALPARAAQRCFVETNQCMDGRIAEFWDQNGGLAVFGFPIGPLEQTTVDGKTFTVQR
ncbi:MAG: class F sortase, partial [Roseiflexaceae bacterium]